MTPDQIKLIQDSFAKVDPIRDQAAELFYTRLFETDPSLRPLFPDDMTEQKKKLMATIALVVASLDRIEQVMPAVRNLGKSHAGYGVKAADYDTVGGALLWTLEQGLGPAWNADVAAAWTGAYGFLATEMQAAAAEA